MTTSHTSRKPRRRRRLETVPVNGITLETSADGKRIEVTWTDEWGVERQAISENWIAPGDGIISHRIWVGGLRRVQPVEVPE